MSKYCSILFGSELHKEIGPFRFPIWKELAPGEIRGIEEIARKQSQSTFYSLKLAHKIAIDKKVSEEDALAILGSLTNDANKNLIYEYAEELDQIQTSTMSETAIKIEYVTVFMQFRGQVKMPDSNEYKDVPDWTIADSERLPGSILQEIYDLCIQERDAQITPEDGDSTKKAQVRTRRV